MPVTVDIMGQMYGVTWFDYQEEALDKALMHPGPAQRRCLYYKTGAGKSLTSLGMMKLWGQKDVLVIAPPSTHAAWEGAAERFEISVECMSHAKFRMKTTKLSRNKAVIADEFHMFGGHGKDGFSKLERLARNLQAPMVLASATPNYNDADRVFCIQTILDPLSTKGGFIAFLYQQCETEPNPFGQEPIVTGFLHHASAAEYLAALPNVDYLPDDLVYDIVDVPYREPANPELDRFGYDKRNHRMMASEIEERHLRRYQGLVLENGHLQLGVRTRLQLMVDEAEGPVLVYANHATIAEAAQLSLGADNCTLVTGKTTKKVKAQVVADFNRGKIPVLIGTASLATGTDGMDKVCDTLIILDDTDDDALRRQLIGRIMPRGSDTDASNKQVFRFLPM